MEGVEKVDESFILSGKAFFFIGEKVLLHQGKGEGSSLVKRKVLSGIRLYCFFFFQAREAGLLSPI